MPARRNLDEGGSIFPTAQLEEKRRKSFEDRQFARSSMPRAREVRFVVTGSDVDLQMVVTDATHDVTAKLIAAVFAAGGMTIEDSDFATGPNQRRLFQRHRFNGGIFFSVLWIYHRLRHLISSFRRPRFCAGQRHRKISYSHRSHLTESR